MPVFQGTMSGVFITGTDTGAGKTRITTALMEAMKSKGLTVAGMKPVACGCTVRPGGPRNDDALLLQKHASHPPPYERVNPYALPLPASPQLAAEQARVVIHTGPLVDAYHRLTVQAEIVVVEGIGGWRVYLDRDLQMADLIKVLRLPVILVVGLRLGCINHAMLSLESILADNIRLLGWIGNHIDPNFLHSRESVAFLTRSFDAPLLGDVPYLP
ncbi:MAG: dethiobiotin synthase, partial [Gammaproteobacteria bacterium]